MISLEAVQRVGDPLHGGDHLLEPVELDAGTIIEHTQQYTVLMEDVEDEDGKLPLNFIWLGAHKR